MSELANDLLTGAAAAAAYIGIKPRTVYHMVEQGRIPHTRLGTLLVFRKSELDKFFAGDADLAAPPDEPLLPIIVEKGVAVPERWARSPVLALPFDEMVHGDSFFIPGNKLITRVRCAVSARQRATGERYTTRLQNAGLPGGGIRVWRLASDAAPPEGSQSGDSDTQRIAQPCPSDA